MQDESATKDHIFRARFDQEDRNRLKFLEEELGMNGSEVLRRLMKEKCDALHAVREEHRLLFSVMEETIRRNFAPITEADLRSPSFKKALAALRPIFFPRAEFPKGTGPVLHDLVRWGHVKHHNGRFTTTANRPELPSNRPLEPLLPKAR